MSTAGQGEGDLRVTEVVVHRNGVGHFTHEGTVVDDEVVTLPVAEDDVDDLLGSLLVFDPDGAAPQVTFPARDPLARILAGYAIDLSDDPDLRQVLARARGERVTVTSTETVSGRVLGVDTVENPRGPQQTYLVMSTGTGLRRIELAHISGILFEDPALRRDLDAALLTLATTRRRAEREVRIRFRGTGERRVRLAYVRPMPVWKTAYRLVLGDDGHADLQGWAIVDNPTGTDLRDVRISVVAGDPMSFVTSLAEPRHVTRPRVEPAVTKSVVPATYAAAEDAGRMAAPVATSRAAPGGAPMAAAARIEPAAQAAPSGLDVHYTVAEPVTVPRYTSAMIPILQHRLPASRRSVFDADVDPRHPMRAVLLGNPDGVRLAAGPVTVYDGGYAGTARLADLLPGASQILTYARDIAVTVHDEPGRPRTDVTLSVVGAVMRQTTTRSAPRTFTVTGPVTGDRLVMVVVPAIPDSRQRADGPAPLREGAHHRYGVVLGGTDPSAPGDDITALPVQAQAGPGAAATLVVTTLTRQHEDVQIDAAPQAQLRLCLDGGELGDAQRDLLARLADLASDRERVTRELRQVARRRDAIEQEQARIRGNLGELDHSSQLYQRYLGRLNTQEDELAGLRQREIALEEEQEAVLDPLRELTRRLADLAPGGDPARR